MDKEAKEQFDRANAKVHPVETQWHHATLVAAGFEAVTKETTGFVRKYEYVHPDGRRVTCCTGLRSDFWQSGDKRGYWSDLEGWCKSS